MLLMITKWTQVRPGIVYITCVWLLPPLTAFTYIGCEVWETNLEKTGEAVEDHVGGSNRALAQKIAREHPGAPDNHVHCGTSQYFSL